jgi:hypothetical protein
MGVAPSCDVHERGSPRHRGHARAAIAGPRSRAVGGRAPAPPGGRVCAPGLPGGRTRAVQPPGEQPPPSRLCLTVTAAVRCGRLIKTLTASPIWAGWLSVWAFFDLHRPHAPSTLLGLANFTISFYFLQFQTVCLFVSQLPSVLSI